MLPPGAQTLLCTYISDNPCVFCNESQSCSFPSSFRWCDKELEVPISPSRPTASKVLLYPSGAVAETECLILDIRMPGMDGLQLQSCLNDSGAGVPIIFLTAHDDAKSRRLAIDGGALDFLAKPFEANSLLVAVRNALTRHAVNRRGA